MMIPGVWTSYFMELSVEDMVVEFAKAGWFSLELSDEHSAVLLKRGNPETTGREIRAFAADRGVNFPQGHLWLDVDVASKNQQEVIDNLKRWLDLFVAVGITSAVIHPGGGELMEEGASKSTILDAQVRAFRLLTDFTAGTDLVLCLENVDRTPRIYDLLTIINAVSSPNLAICLDTGHLNIAGESQGEFIRKAGILLQALHIADNEGKRDQHLMPFGVGNVTWKEVVGALKEIGYSKLFNFEIPGERRCPIPVRRAKLDYLRVVVSHLLNEV